MGLTVAGTSLEALRPGFARGGGSQLRVVRMPGPLFVGAGATMGEGAIGTGAIASGASFAGWSVASGRGVPGTEPTGLATDNFLPCANNPGENSRLGEAVADREGSLAASWVLIASRDSGLARMVSGAGEKRAGVVMVEAAAAMAGFCGAAGAALVGCADSLAASVPATDIPGFGSASGCSAAGREPLSAPDSVMAVDSQSRVG